MSVWWERRRVGELRTAGYLARVLRELGAPALAEKAARCHYDDYFCPPDIDDGMNIHHLIRDLESWAAGRDPVTMERAAALIAAATEGEFDGTRAEAQAWAKSADGQDTFAELMRGRGRGGNR